MKLIILLLFAIVAVPASARLSPDQLAQAGAHPLPGAVLPTSLSFTDQRDEPVTLGKIADGKPLVLLFVDYTCRHICGPGLTLSAKALADSGLTIGRDYNFVLVGMDPRDGIDKARIMQRMRLGALPRMQRASWFLVGDKANVAAATKALGYGYVYDPTTDQFAHDASLYVFAADGHVASVLPELALTPDIARAAIQNSSAAHPKSNVLVQAARLCYGFAAAHGVYGQPIAVALQAMGVLLIACFAGWFGFVRWRSRKRER
ncbi:MAG: SCO family protein [Sphingomonas sp.]